MSCQLVLEHALPEDEPVELSRHVHLSPTPSVVPQARAFVLGTVPDLPPGTRDVLRLLTSELVTNAVIHARTPFEVGVTVGREHVLVTVHDLDLGHREHDPDGRDGGRGLELVRALAEHAELTHHPEGGKTAWFRVLREVG